MATVEEDQPTAVPEAKRSPSHGQGDETDPDKTERKITKDGKVELKEHDAWDKLGYSFPTWRKW